MTDETKIPLATEAVTALNDPDAWVRDSQPATGPHDDRLPDVQRQLDQLVGLTRDLKSIVKIVWNGDQRYWKRVYRKWDTEGEPMGDSIGRPVLLYKTIRDPHGNVVRDSFPPRYLVLTRIEPEQYHDEWAKDGTIYHPRFRKRIRIKPAEPPKDWYIWLMTVAEHDGRCCFEAQQQERSCFGSYAPPAACLPAIKAMVDGAKESGIKTNPFDSSDALTRRQIDNSINNYNMQALKDAEFTLSMAASEFPLAFATPQELAGGLSLAEIRRRAADRAKRKVETFDR